MARSVAVSQNESMKAIAGIFIGALFASGQQPAAPAPDSQRPEVIFTVTSTLVQVDAVVTDSKGHHITDLKPEDFQVFEDGKLQKLTHFSYVQVTPIRSVKSDADPVMNAPSPPGLVSAATVQPCPTSTRVVRARATPFRRASTGSAWRSPDRALALPMLKLAPG